MRQKHSPDRMISGPTHSPTSLLACVSELYELELDNQAGVIEQSDLVPYYKDILVELKREIDKELTRIEGR